MAGRYDGWRQDLENVASLRRMSTPFKLNRAVRGPRSWSYRGLLKIEDQGQQGSCTGHAGTSVLEVLNYIKTKAWEQFCRQWLYIQGQKIDGIRGDQGATIEGVVKAMQKVGICREELSPYNGQYYTNFPAACSAEALKHLLAGQVTEITSAQMADDYLRSGTGGIYFGCDCVKTVMDSKGRVETFSGPSAGGHAMCFLSMDGDDFDGPQSWGEQAGDHGWNMWSRRATETMIHHPNSVVLGITDLQQYGEQRDVSYSGVMG